MNLRTLRDTPPWDWPAETGELLLGILRDDRAGEPELLLAVELAGDLTVMNDDVAGALLAILRSGDKSDEVRGRAAISLGPVLEDADTQGFDDVDDAAIGQSTFRRIQASLRTLYMDAGVPRDVRRRVLEASVRAPQEWHPPAIRAAYVDDDAACRLTAVFCMRFVRGFDQQILEALEDDDDIHYEAVVAAGNWEVDAAWPHIAALVTSGQTDKPLLLAAIDAAASIRPDEAADILSDLADSDDEDIVAAVHEALAMAMGPSDEDEDDEIR